MASAFRRESASGIHFRLKPEATTTVWNWRGRLPEQEVPVSALIRIIVLILFAAVSVHAQALNSGSDGTDGALTLTEAGEVVFDPVAMGLDTDRDNVFHFTTITIGAGVTVRMPFNKLQGAPVIWLATGAVQIDGTIDLNGQHGPPPIPGLLNRASVPGPGGYPGGVGGGGSGFAGANLLTGLGPGGGSFCCGGVGLSAGHVVDSGGPAYGNALLVPLRGGSGGGASGNTAAGGGGGAGGGALRVFSSTSIAVTGAILTNGGNGASFAGGGSGGSIHLIAPTISGAGTLSASGGLHGGGGASNASDGRIRLDAVSNQFAGETNAFVTRGTPYNVPLPAAMPVVRVTSIAGVPIAASPTGDAATPDATINQTGPVTVAVEAKNIPPGTVVQVRIMSEAVPDFVVNAAPLQGTLEFSTATANVTFPPGFSRGLVRATWSPPVP
jgi:hypothetical protein